MKTIAINGASGKIGSSIVSRLSDRHNIVVVEGRLPYFDEIIEEIRDCDIFINNAMHEWGQVDLLFRLYDVWRTQAKLIINIGSRAAAPNVSRGYEYSTVKASINHFSDLVRFKDEEKMCRITTLNPGLVGEQNDIALSPHYIADVIAWVVNQPNNVEISRLDISHTAQYELVQRKKQKISK